MIALKQVKMEEKVSVDIAEDIMFLLLQCPACESYDVYSNDSDGYDTCECCGESWVSFGIDE